MSYTITLCCRGITKYNRAGYLKYKYEKRILNDGVNAKVPSVNIDRCLGLL
ncbi:hypothetical protein SOVF_212090 [Spinacia oleracea]|nr:hypothetical protein SOVF_212090 [Spinacia oleracea]